MSTIFRDVVQVGGLTFNDKAIDELGVRYQCDLLAGWDDTAQPTVVTASFTYSDGVVAAERFPLKEQYIDVGGYLRAPTELALELAKEKIRVAFAGAQNLRLVRYGPLPKAMDVVTSGPVEFPQTLRGKTDNAARFLVQVMAPWPFKESPLPFIAEAGAFSGASYFRTYSGTYKRSYTNYHRTYQSTAPTAVVTRPDSLVVINGGTADGYPTFEVYGPLTSGEWILVNETTNQQMAFDVDLGVEPIIIDTRNKVATVFGQSVDYFQRGEWLRLVPGGNRIRLLSSDDSPDAFFRIISYDTYR